MNRATLFAIGAMNLMRRTPTVAVRRMTLTPLKSCLQCGKLSPNAFCSAEHRVEFKKTHKAINGYNVVIGAVPSGGL